MAPLADTLSKTASSAAAITRGSQCWYACESSRSASSSTFEPRGKQRDPQLGHGPHEVAQMLQREPRAQMVDEPIAAENSCGLVSM